MADDGEDEEGLLMAPESYVAAAVTLFFIGFLGFFCNLVVIVIMCRDKQLWTPLNVILFNLVCSDFSVSILGNPFTLISAIFRRWIFGRAMCILYGFFMSLLGITSITTLMVLSFERYLMISKPLHTRHLSKKGAMVLVVAIWIYSLILTTPPLLGWGSYVHEAANISCSVNWESRTLGTTTYIVFLFAMGLVVPVFVISFSYLNIIRTMKQHSSLRVGRVTKAESKVAFMVGAMIVSFLVAWTPYAVLALLIAFGDPHIVTPGMAVVPALIAKSSICYNPLIYVGLNTQFRSSWKKLIGAKNSLEASQDPGGENTFLSPTRMVSQAPGEDQRLSVSKVMAKASEEKTAVEPRTVTHRPVITINKPKKTLYSVFQDQWSKKQPRVKLRTEGTTVSGVNSTKVDEVEEIELGDITTLKIVPNIKPV